MKEHSDVAWKIASLYSTALASETRDLAAHIDLALKRERDAIAAKAREWAEHYPQSSDGRNTFILLAEWIDVRQ